MPSATLIAQAIQTPVVKTLTFTGLAGAGLNASLITFFTVTGSVKIVSISGRVTTDLTVSNVLATIALGVVGALALFIPATLANTLLTAAANWVSATPTAGGILLPAITQNTITNANIVGTVGGTGNITGGVLELTCVYQPLSAGASVVPA